MKKKLKSIKSNKKFKNKFKTSVKIIQKNLKKTILYNKKTSNFLIKSLKYSLLIIISLQQLLFLIIFLLTILLNFANPKFTSLMFYRKIINKQKNKKIVFIPLKYISKKTKSNIIGIEDFKFYKHIGIDPEAIIEAYNINKKLGYKFRGGSTITQQLARTLFLVPEKNYFRKYLEILIALELDLFLTKKRILELYINYIEFGNGVYGIGKASLYYYHKPYNKLNIDEINKLLTIIPNPKKYNPNNFYKNRKLLTRYYLLTSWS